MNQPDQPTPPPEMPPCPQGKKWHNPGKLTAAQFETEKGWRPLVQGDEVNQSPFTTGKPFQLWYKDRWIEWPAEEAPIKLDTYRTQCPLADAGAKVKVTNHPSTLKETLERVSFNRPSTDFQPHNPQKFSVEKLPKKQIGPDGDCAFLPARILLVGELENPPSDAMVYSKQHDKFVPRLSVHRGSRIEQDETACTFMPLPQWSLDKIVENARARLFPEDTPKGIHADPPQFDDAPGVRSALKEQPAPLPLCRSQIEEGLQCSVFRNTAFVHCALRQSLLAITERERAEKAEEELAVEGEISRKMLNEESGRWIKAYATLDRIRSYCVKHLKTQPTAENPIDTKTVVMLATDNLRAQLTLANDKLARAIDFIERAGGKLNNQDSAVYRKKAGELLKSLRDSTPRTTVTVERDLIDEFEAAVAQLTIRANYHLENDIHGRAEYQTGLWAKSNKKVKQLREELLKHLRASSAPAVSREGEIK